MKLRFAIVAVLALLWSQSAHAQAVGEAVVEGPGYKVGEGTVIHPSVGAETGYISNLFFEDSDPLATGVMRILASLDIATLPPERMGEDDGSRVEPSKIEFRTGLNLIYREILSSNDNAKQQRALGVGANLDFVAFPAGTINFKVRDVFRRDTRPANFETSQNLNRMINRLRAEVQFRPGGGAIKTGLRYENTFDYFESASVGSFANRLQHTFGLRVDWKLFPFTKIYADASLGIFGPMGDNTLAGVPYKNSSLPLRLVLGGATALSELSSLRAWLGFAKGFYEAGPDFTTPIGFVEYGYRYSPMGRFKVSYDYDVQDSINANFYSQHRIRAGLDHQVGVFILDGNLETGLRTYQGVPASIGAPNRTDFILGSHLALRYVLDDWMAISAEYRLTLVNTDYMATFGAGGGDDPSFTRHELFLGARAAF